MLFARSERCHPRRVKRLKTQCLAGSQVVVCKIHQPPFLVPAALFPTISFYLLGVGLAIFLPIVRVRPAPLPWTLQAGMLIAHLLLRMVRRRLKSLLPVAARAVPHQAAPEENGRGSFSLGAP